MAAKEMLRLLQAPSYFGKFSFQLLRALRVVPVKLGAQRTEDSVGDATFKGGDLVGQFLKGLH
jgi:hypothetical protein